MSSTSEAKQQTCQQIILIKKNPEQTETEDNNQSNTKKSQLFLSELYPFKKKKPVAKHILPKCIICKKPGKYQCPRCSVRYCSTQHYKSHNLFCSEQFYEQNVKQDLKGIKVSKQEKQKAKKMIEEHQKQLHQQQTIQTITQDRFEQILKDLQENGVQNVKLSYKQQLEFANFIKQWVKQNGQTPFWQIQDGLSRMFIIQSQHLYENKVQIQQYNQSKHPQILTYRQLLRQRLSKLISFDQMKIKDNKNVSKQIIYHISYLIYLGTIIFRYLDGQYSTAEFREIFINLSKPIFPTSSKVSTNQIKNFEQIIILIKSRIIKLNYQFEYWCYIAMIDTKNILKNKYLMIQMLFRIYDSFYSKDCNIEQKTKTRILKKIQFLISYTMKNWNTALKQYNIILQQINFLLKQNTQQSSQ